jgi:hypothetical protein
MGIGKYSVWEWNIDKYEKDPFEYVLAYAGDSLLKAVYTMWKLKQQGAGCMKFEWR